MEKTKGNKKVCDAASGGGEGSTVVASFGAGRARKKGIMGKPVRKVG